MRAYLRPLTLVPGVARVVATRRDRAGLILRWFWSPCVGVVVDLHPGGVLANTITNN